MKQTLAPVISNDEIMPGTHFIWLKSPQVADIAKPGQFAMVYCGEDTLLRRPFSIHQIDGDKIALLFRIVGTGTKWLSAIKAKDSLDILGPLGNGFTINSDSKNLLLVAGGIGIAPLIFLAKDTLKQGKAVTLMLGAPTSTELYPEKPLPAGVKLITATEDGSAGKKAMITDLLVDFTAKADQVFACGPVGMYKTMAGMPELKYKSAQVSLEIMMGCGVGVCYGCTIKTTRGLKQVCQHGPVFELKDIIWEELASE